MSSPLRYEDDLHKLLLKNMSEKFPYNLEKAQEEDVKIQAKIKIGEVENYEKVEKQLIESETKNIILTPDEVKLKKAYISEAKKTVEEKNIRPESLKKIIESLFYDIESDLSKLERSENMDMSGKESKFSRLIKLNFELNCPIPKEDFSLKIKSLLLRYSNLSRGRYLDLTEILPEIKSRYADVLSAFTPDEFNELIEKSNDQYAYGSIKNINNFQHSLLYKHIKNDFYYESDRERAVKPVNFIKNRKERLINEGVLKEIFLKETNVHTFGLEGMILTKKLLELPDDFIKKDEDILNAVKSSFISKIKDKSRHFGYDTYWRDILRTKEELHIPDEIISEIALEAVTIYLDKGDFESVAGIKADTKISPRLIQEYFKGKISQEDWKSVFTLNRYFDECQPLYKTKLTELKRIAGDTNLQFQERQKAIDSLAALSQNGDSEICYEFSTLIENRSSQSDSPESRWGLDPAQEAAFYTLIRLDNPESNNTLFKLLLNENVNNTVKYATLKKLSSEKRNFLTDYAKSNLRAWLNNRKTNNYRLDWRDMEFINAILKIPSTETRYNSLQQTESISHIYHYNEEDNEIILFEYNEDIYHCWENYKDIPQNSFLQLHRFLAGDEALLQKFQNLYSANKKETTKKENLLYGIVNIQYSNYEIQKLVINKLREISFGAKEDIDKISELFRQIAFLDKIDELKKSSSYDDEYYKDYEDEEYERQDDEPGQSQEVIEILSKKVESLDELINLLKEISTKKIQEILPNEKITGEKIETIEKNWGNLEPIFTYLSRYPQLKEYISEMAAHFDNKEDWKNWRYDTENKSVKSQVGFLSSKQLEIWKSDYFSEMGDIMIAESGSDKPKKVQSILEDAITKHRHIYNPEMGQNKFEYVQKFLEYSLRKIKETPGERENIIEDDIKSVATDAEAIDCILDFNNISRIKQGLNSVLPENHEVQISKKIKDTVKFLYQYLPKDLGESLNENHKKTEGKDKIKSEELITPEIRNSLNEKIKEIEENYKKIIDSQIWEKLDIDRNNLKNLGQFYQKRQELKAIIDLLRLNNSSNKLIATNRIAKKEGKKGGETIMEVIESLKKFFKDTPLLLDLKNIESALKEKIDFGEKRRLAMILTDDPQMLWQAGKYPLGNGSCQHYAEGSYAHNLMGYVGDANCKVSYLVDLNKLPLDIKKELDEKDFEEVKEKIPMQELLNASLARSVIKLTKNKINNPTILLEPTYTVVYKGDSSIDKYYNIFIDLMIVEPMKAKMARGGGDESVSKGRSRSPEGQYEDLNLDNVKFIQKLSKPNKEDMEIMERIRSSR